MTHNNWTGIKSDMSKLKKPHRALTTKFIHGWLPTHAFLHKQRRETSSCCPVCCHHSVIETIEQCMSCPEPSAVAHREVLLRDSLVLLRTKSHTSPLILNCWEENLRRELGLPERPLPKAPCSMQLKKVVKVARQHQTISAGKISLAVSSPTNGLRLFPHEGHEEKDWVGILSEGK